MFIELFMRIIMKALFFYAFKSMFYYNSGRYLELSNIDYCYVIMIRFFFYFLVLFLDII